MDDSTRLTLADGADLLGLTVETLWWRYFGLGGALDPSEFAALVTDRQSAPGFEGELAAQAMNEAFLDLGILTYPIGSFRVPRATVAPRRIVRGEQLLARRRAAMVRAQELQDRAAALIRTRHEPARHPVGLRAAGHPTATGS